jgi:hypothetical protein
MQRKVMDFTPSPFPERPSRLGFHYYPDTLHYCESDLFAWLPELSALGASWLVLQSPPDRAIPEYFLKGLIDAGIEPIIQYDLPLLNPPDPAEVRPILSAYSHWGVHSVVWFNRPNSWQAWTSCGWGQQDLVERFLDRFLPYAAVSRQTGLNPVFPPLEPGGSYWDTSFLRSTLQALDRRRQYSLLEDLVLSAYAWTGGHSLNWGAGGPGRWPKARPYGLKSAKDGEETQDQRGFRIFDWYQAAAQSVLGRKVPQILFAAGTDSDPLILTSPAQSGETHAQTSLAIAKLLAGEPVSDPLESEKELEAVPQEVVACNLWLLTAGADSKYQSKAWFRNREPVQAVEALKAWQSTRRARTAPPSAHVTVGAPGSSAQNSTRPEKSYPIEHYLLLPTYEFGVADWHLNVIRPFIKKFRPTVGFSLVEAALAARVTVIGSPQSFSEDALDSLRMAGSIVERIHGDGTTIATILAER